MEGRKRRLVHPRPRRQRSLRIPAVASAWLLGEVLGIAKDRQGDAVAKHLAETCAASIGTAPPPPSASVERSCGGL